jgi:hypothetical protein
MSDDRRQPMDPDRAEQLMAGAGDPSDPVARLLAAVRAPAMAEELAREDHAVVAFRMSRWSADTERHAAPPRQRTGWARAFGVKGLAIGLGTAIALGGVALAATTGVLPNPLTGITSDNGTSQAPRTSSAAPGSTPRTEPGPGQSVGSPTAHPGQGTGSPTGVGTGSPTEAPDPALMGLCRSAAAHDYQDLGKWLDASGFERLKTAAGSEDKIADYCTTLLGSGPVQGSDAHSPAAATAATSGPPE